MRNSLHLHIASRCNIHCSPQRFRNLAKHPRHFRRSLEIKLVRRELHAVCVAHRLAGLNAQQNFLCVGIFVMQVVAIVRGHQRNPSFF